ncbi:MAG: orotidine-5'-phosphate decarboxylase [Acidaminococcus fermentans]|uniref:Orotidine 5'-phosphate decarboxylase n=2 Tax=Acidaminococcus fermentans TaxID=905 RepID=A0A1H2SZK5_ACIFE|nr:orotidine-5'-phosphate decarboxylase [Acidaminococcus fermentans]MCF0140168.1 orotidine-5'-phosphate decarboxylase [Acidaminococcus fermentans]MCI6285945.1 orotidine-5'-phosphate decarboxylase [Acidaminococcus fermentans]MDD7195780.1 orotidine-5'-phosphate decarboxylase [Acidaminococcus fermentans]MDY2852421.1 orotidine-5'-phosphate decarboxylase [Acidaminococcus fermentans]MDY4147595.1 orotidine-5'-phosphate decarboxylase [Acidaminococcus fermentans]
MDARDRLICALDFPTFDEAKALVEELGDAVTFYKVGMELFYGAGPDIIRYLKEKDKKVFLDLKLQDIPNTVAHSLAVLTRLGADIMNVHAVGGSKMMAEGMKAVKEAAAELGRPAPKLIAVTVLTSMDEAQWKPLNYARPIGEEVLDLAALTKESGLDGVVASPREAAGIRERCGKDFLIVTPGVRPAWAASNDQSRIATPAAAIGNGSTHLVVGRPITRADNKQEAVRKILEEMEGAF